METRSHVVLVDDNADKRFILTRHITKKFPHVDLRAYADVKSGFEDALETDVALVITNGKIGKREDGIQMISKLRSVRPELPIMMITLHLDIEEKARLAGTTLFFDETQQDQIFSAMEKILSSPRSEMPER